jgi:hypothetical protein
VVESPPSEELNKSIDIRLQRLKTSDGDEIPIFDTLVENFPKLNPRNYNLELRRVIKKGYNKKSVNIISSMNMSRVILIFSRLSFKIFNFLQKHIRLFGMISSLIITEHIHDDRRKEEKPFVC